MIELLGSVIEFVFEIIGLAFTIVFDAVGFVFGLLGGLLSLIFSLGGIILVIVLVRAFIKRRSHKQQPSAPQTIYVDEDGEEFVSYYAQQDQQR